MDKKALQILFQTYWSPAGWRKERETAPEDFRYAKQAGVMFDPVTEEDAALLRSIFDTIEGVRGNTTAPQLHGKLSALFKSNKSEREVVVKILGFCAILRAPGHPGYWDRFVPYRDRELPPYRFLVMGYPACWWRGRDGLDQNVLHRVFPAI